jgi:ribonuclease HI
LLFEVVPGVLKGMMTAMLRTGYFPSEWKCANVIFFAKKNKDPCNPRSYRPVCLLSTLSKVLERIINNRIIYFLETNAKLHSEQFGFREGRNTTLCISHVINLIKQSIRSYKYTAMVLFDFESAFDTADWGLLLSSLHELGVDNNVVTIIKSYLRNRRVGFTTNEVFEAFKIDRGCPQGSCLGPTLWNLIANKLLIDFNAEDCDLVAYADDFVMLVAGNTRQELELKTNRLIARFADRSDEYKLRISSDKTKAVLFGKDLSRRYPIFKLNGSSIKIVEYAKYLGVLIDRHLGFTHHLSYLNDEIVSYNTKIKRVGNAYWGVSIETLRIWYIAVVEAKLCYAIQAWFPCLNCHGRRKLDSIQRKCLVKILKCYRTVSNMALYVLTGIPPITLKATYLVQQFDLRYRSGILVSNDQSFCKDDFEWTTLRCQTNPSVYPDNLKVVLDPEDSLNLYGLEDLVIYTDGSKQEEGVGLSFVAFDEYGINYWEAVSLRSANSVFQAEAQALLSALRWCRDKQVGKVILRSDSLSSIMALCNVCPKSSLIQEFLRECLYQRNKHILVGWVKAHDGELGNETADYFAKAAVDLGVCELRVPYPSSFLRKIQKDSILEAWQNLWTNSTKGRYTYEICNNVGYDLKFKNKVLTFFVTGQGSFPSFLHKIGKRSSDSCVCGDAGTPHHYAQVSCSFSREFVKRGTSESLLAYYRRIDNSKFNVNKLERIYNLLNENYSFIYSSF